MKYYIIAGEASGDLHGSNLMKGLLAQDSNADIRFWGGGCMEAVGGTMVRDYRDTAVMGISEVLGKIGSIIGNLKFCKKDILDFKPDVVILIDYPGFNMKISRFCHHHGIRNFYYIAPKTWASRSWRNRAIKRYTDKLFIVFPFEKPWFEAAGIPYVYCGNPLLDSVSDFRYTRVTPHPYIAILPGSRSGEISRMMPVCMETVDRLKSLPQYRNYEFHIAGAPSRTKEDYLKYIGDRKDVFLEFDRTYDILKFAEAAIVNSGTASLEAALMSTAQVVCWSTSGLTYFVGKYILRVLKHIKYISLANLIADKLIFKEFIQSDFNADNVTAETRRLIEDFSYRADMMSDYVKVRNLLGCSGASKQVAAAIIKELNQ